MINEFAAKTAVITGGAAGIGLAVAEKCADLGMNLVLADVEMPVLEKTVKRFEKDGVDVIGMRCDVSDYDEVAALADVAFKRFGAVHLLCNNAGVAAGSTVWGSTVKDWEWTFGVNVMGIVHGVKAFVPSMIEQDESSHVVNTASIAGLISGPSMGPYRAAKHAAVSISETLFLELEQANAPVGVSVLCPAWVKTGIYTSERNRPSEFKSAEKQGRDQRVDAQTGQVKEWVDNGLEPAVIAEAVLDAVRTDRFYILTHPPFTKLVGLRMKDILEGNSPTNPMG